jgi:heme-degrading monooxygenase HmoA
MYFIIWDFLVKKDLADEFERAYGNEGTWVSFFKKGTGYLSTFLIKDVTNDRRYITIDRWESKKDYDSFKKGNEEEYRIIDSQCEFLTDEEKLIGYFSDLQGNS